LQSTNELRKKIIEEIIVFLEQKKTTQKKLIQSSNKKLGMTLKQEITTWIPKSEFGLEHPIS